MIKDHTRTKHLQDLPSKGKSSMGFFYGFKWHLLIK
ncbi:MAG: hypothetical protein H6909_03480 [Rickettsiaceae bacterium]|nr:hypothetical protein [Rickettsiaceae bacterium]